ncbi:MAG: exodeoxyribonuclease VII small subunit [Cytophagales bacterium]|nr:exodeoxyribonuclease VII small subunit [Cytophagales bacterium]MDW8384988.1 exodeoxyribonuclease VII small subunit [Flammeovirgaceae bacterium]
MNEELTYQKALEELQNIQRDLQENEVSLEELVQKVHRAHELVAWCEARLTDTERAIKNI